MFLRHPELITQEGVLGNEYNKFDENKCTLRHTVTLPFTRALLGAMDFTPGGFINRTPAAFKPAAVPTQESVVVSGEVAKSIVVARRAGRRWYLAAMNGDAAAELSVPLSFLSAGAWTLRAFADQPDGSDAQAVIESTRPVSPGSVLRLSLAPGGGFAGIITETRTGR